MLQRRNNCSKGKTDSDNRIRRLKNMSCSIHHRRQSKKNIIGQKLLPQIEIGLIQEKPKQGNVLNIREQEQSNPEIKQWVKDNYPQLWICVGKSKIT